MCRCAVVRGGTEPSALTREENEMAAKNEINGMTIPPRVLQSGQITQVVTLDIRTGVESVVYESSDLVLEAPNWTIDGESLVLNGDFDLWKLNLITGKLDRIEMVGVPIVNNDHVLDPDGRHVYVSAFDWHIYRVPLGGGPGERVSGDPGIRGLKHFLHGAHPSGERLSFIGVHPLHDDDRWGLGDVFTMSVDGTDYVQLTHGPGPSDGSEYSSDGEFIYFNTENFDGHAQIARMGSDGRDMQQLTIDEKVNWFPHMSPDGMCATYLAYAPGTDGHPADVWVDLKLVRLDDWRSAETVAHVFGGQGTLNVNSWAPDSNRFAYVAYPMSTQS
jgi:TolB protein